MSQQMVRAFIAIELPVEIQAGFDDVMKRLKASGAVGVRWVASTNIHLTLKFLGDTSPTGLTKLSELLKSVAAQYTPVELLVGGLGAFPNRRQPRVIWVGVRYPPEIQGLYQAIETAAKQIGCPPETRGFSPHLTLGRIQRDASRRDVESIPNAMAAVEVGELGRFQADSFTLFRSDLRPTGSIYTPLAHFSLSR